MFFSFAKGFNTFFAISISNGLAHVEQRQHQVLLQQRLGRLLRGVALHRQRGAVGEGEHEAQVAQVKNF